MSTKPWYPWYVGDARAKMLGLTLEQRGAYRELLDESYIRGGSLPGDTESLWRIAGAHTASERAAVELVASSYFERRGDQLVNKRVEKEIGRSRELSEFGSLGGKVTQAKAKANGKAKPEADVKANIQAAHEADLQAPQPQPQPHTTATAITPLRGPRGKARSTAPESAEAWDSYRAAYLDRYGTEPVRNGKVNTQLKAFVKAVGIDEAPKIAAWYLGHNRAAYVKASHSMGLLAQHAEGLRTEWARQHRVTDTEARQQDQTQATGSVFSKLIEEAEEHQASEGSWWTNDDALMYFGEELGVRAIGGQPLQVYRLRCIAAAGPGEWREGLSPEDLAQVRMFEINGVNPPEAQRGQPRPMSRAT